MVVGVSESIFALFPGGIGASALMPVLIRQEELFKLCI